jgi:hypothetical protein
MLPLDVLGVATLSLAPMAITNVEAAKVAKKTQPCQ